MRRKTPQEKKALSYAKDCRNTYGENDKSSRKNIPLHKARQKRQYRKRIHDVLQKVKVFNDLESIEVVENQALSIKRGNWKKYADMPLGDFLKRKLDWREIHAGKGKTALKQIREIIKNLEIKVEQETNNRWIAEAVNLSNITAVGETRERAIEKLKYFAHAAIRNEMGFDMRILVNGKFIKPLL
jgi:acetolactate synthase small subunit